MLSISVTETACGRPQGALADLRRYAARWAFARRTEDLINHQQMQACLVGQYGLGIAQMYPEKAILYSITFSFIFTRFPVEW